MYRIDDIIWSAGFPEGEGSAGLYAKKDGQPILQMSAQQKFREPLDVLQDLYGGSVYESESREIYGWSVSGRSALHAIRAVLPYMRSSYKVEQFESSVEKYLDHIAESGREKNITRRKGGKLDVRVGHEGKSIFVGSFRSGREARAALASAISRIHSS